MVDAAPPRPSCWAPSGPAYNGHVPICQLRTPHVPHMTRFTRLSLLTVAAVYLLVVVGGVVRGTGSGLGCPDWPLCYDQLFAPAGNAGAWIEWTHRALAALIGVLVLGLVILAVRSYRERREILWPTIAALVLTVFQAVLGKITVDTGNAGEWVTAHLATAMVLLGLLAYLAIRSRYPA
jgi:heme A synthase